MRRSRITITIDQDLLKQIDTLIDHNTIRNRSHAMENVLSQYFLQKITTAVILAGGQGTNLRPYTYEVPKSLMPVKGKPILEYLIQNLKSTGIRHIYLCVGYLGDKIKEQIGNGEKYGLTITYVQEKSPLLTGGALLQLKNELKHEPFLLLHGDIVTDFNFRDIIEFHQKETATVSVALTTVNQPQLYGQLRLHGSRLVGFYQHDEIDVIKSHLVNCGIYVCNPDIFNYFPKSVKPFLFEDIIQVLVAENKVNGFVYEGNWYDVGTLENYERAIKEFK